MAELIEFKCPGCGGSIEFDTSEQKMKCPYCDCEFDVGSLKKYEEQLNNPQNDEYSWNTNEENTFNDSEESNLAVYTCSSCAGEIICDETTAASKCPYCGSNVIFSSRISGKLKPDYIIPFKYDKNAAKESLLNHFKGKKLLPHAFKDENHIDEIKGIYVPFWLYSAKADISANFEGTKCIFWSDSNYNYTKTDHFSIIRDGKTSFSKSPADGSSKMPDDLMESLEPYDFSEMIDFTPAYLSGFLADKYDVPADANLARINDRIKESSVIFMRNTISGYTSLTTKYCNVKLCDSFSKYALLPVWILNTTWKDKKYIFAMNGQTGKFVGDLPCDNKLYFKWLALLSAAISAGIFAAIYLLFNM